ncbi:hypothetical protein ACFV9C_42140 [Kribbella sp. NPDC059898]|uniref:hypothetical protein n=1 Tax=Kribbella sp. NPDC059898 TaxID=3346995 RepID=UPI003654A366
MLNVNGIQAFLIVIAGLLSMFIGISIMGKSKKAQISDVAQTSLISVIGMVFIAIGMGSGLVLAFGGDLLKLIFNK